MAQSWKAIKWCVVCAYFLFSFICSAVNACAQPAAVTNQSPNSGYNVVLIILDSVRPDHLSCYGYLKNTSPAIDKFASEGIVFDQVIAQSTWSLPSHCSIVTSKYVPSHGVDRLNKKLAASELTLADILKLYGYRTVAFTGGFWISSVFNVGKGFELYKEKIQFGKLKDTAPQAIDWLKKHREEKFFLLLQGFDGHSPFELPKEYKKMYADPSYNGVFRNITLDHRVGDRLSGHTFFPEYGNQKKVEVTDKDISYIISQYDGSVTYADHYIQVFLQALDELALVENTIVILTSYHGTPLFEHGIILRRIHGGCAEGTIRVPLIIRHPGIGRKGMRVAGQVQLIDLMPTILDMTGIPVNHQAQGKSLVPLLENRAGAESDEYAYSNGAQEKAIRTREWKLIETGSKPNKVELYDLKSDPGEKNNVSAREEIIAAGLKQRLDEWSKTHAAPAPGKANSVAESDIKKIKKTMKQAGYWFLDVAENRVANERDIPQQFKK